MEKFKIHGLVSAPFTPMHPNGQLNLDQIGPYAQKLKDDGVKGAFICGTTGEGMLLTPGERIQVAEAWIEEQTKDFKIIVHTGSTSAQQAKELATHAQQIGADATAAMAPPFLPPSQVSELISFCVMAASGAPQLPFYYYHIPSISGVHISPYEFLLHAEEAIPNFRGIKFTDNNLMAFQQCLTYGSGKFDILHGYDEMLLAGLSLGVKGAVGSTYNYMAPLYYQIIEAYRKKELELARDLQLRSVRLVEVLLDYGGAMSAGKKIMQLTGIDCGPVRAPLKPFEEERTADFIKNLNRTGFSF